MNNNCMKTKTFGPQSILGASLALIISIFVIGSIIPAGIAYAVCYDGSLLGLSGLNSIVIYEETTIDHPDQYVFSKSDNRLVSKLNVGINSKDFSTNAREYYDVFVSDQNGTFNQNGGYLTIDCFRDDHRTNIQAGNNIDAVELKFSGKPSIYANRVSHIDTGTGLSGSYVSGLGERALGAPDIISTRVGDQYSSITLGFCAPQEPETLNVSCSASPSSIQIGQNATFTSTVSGGTGSYSYFWTGACSGSASNCTKTLNSPGTMIATVHVTSGNTTKTANCQTEVIQPALLVSCSASPSSIQVGQNATFTSAVTGGTGSYSYWWSGACTGSASNCTKTLLSAGEAKSTITVVSGNQTVSAYCSTQVNALPTQDLSVSCSATPSSINVGQSTAFISSVSGGTGSYSYLWSGACSGTFQNCNNTFSNPGTQTASVVVTSGGHTATANCTVNINQSNQNLNVYCSANPGSINVGQSAIFTASASGGTGSYYYSWSGACSGSSLTCSNVFNYQGTQTASVTITSGGQTATANCLVNVNNQTNNHSYTQCYGGDVYWYDSQGGRQELYQDCNSGYDGYNYNYNYNSGNNYCIGNSVYRQGYSNRGCANGACYNTGSGNAQLVQTCAYNQTCQNGNCVNTINYNDHRGCYGNAVYWFDSYNVRQSLIQTCLYNQTCQNGYCVTNYIPPTPTPVNYKGCYNGDVYWFDPSTNVRLSFYKTCSDNNACTLDTCSGAGKCTSVLKCDGTTCAKGTDSYISQCTVCGDGVCDQGETIQSCAQDCNVIGLAVTIFGKKENDPVQWTKSFSADASQNLDFLLVVSNGLDTAMNNVSVRTDLPSEILYKGDLKLDGNDYSGDIRSGVSLGSLAPRSTRTLTFKGQVADTSYIFRNEADALATVVTSAGSSQDTARVNLNKAVAINNKAVVVQQGLAGVLGINLSNPLYLFLIIIIIILVLLGIARMIQGFRRD